MTSFDTNCTLPQNVVNYVSQPNTRGTTDILWTCFATLFLCTWSIQHPNVPVLKQVQKQKLKGIPGKMGMMLFSLFVPEFMFMKSIGEWSCARELGKSLREKFGPDGPRWSITHSFFTNMGGFVIHFTEDHHYDGIGSQLGQSTSQLLSQEQTSPQRSSVKQSSEALREISSNTDCEKGATLSIPKTTPWREKLPSAAHKQAYSLLGLRMDTLPDADDRNSKLVQEILEDFTQRAHSIEGTGRLVGKLLDDVSNLIRLRGNYWALDGVQLILAQELGIISQIPNVPNSDVEDKSNGDFLVKFLAVAQAGWQVIQLIIRWAKGLPSSQVEVVTVGFALCALCVYVFWWKKPQDAQVPYLVQARRFPTRDEMYQLADIGPTYMGSLYTGHWYRIPEHAFHMDGMGTGTTMQGGTAMWVGGLACAVLLGLLHCTAWNFHFPTGIERTLWRCASVITSSLPLLYAARGLSWMMLGIKTRGTLLSSYGRLDQLFDTIGSIVYAGARLFLLTETVRTIFFLEPDTFLTSF